MKAGVRSGSLTYHLIGFLCGREITGNTRAKQPCVEKEKQTGQRDRFERAIASLHNAALDDARWPGASERDVAVSQAGGNCHNSHVDSPRTDFALNDVTGGIVIRIPVS